MQLHPWAWYWFIFLASDWLFSKSDPDGSTAARLLLLYWDSWSPYTILWTDSPPSWSIQWSASCSMLFPAFQHRGRLYSSLVCLGCPSTMIWWILAVQTLSCYQELVFKSLVLCPVRHHPCCTVPRVRSLTQKEQSWMRATYDPLMPLGLPAVHHMKGLAPITWNFALSLSFCHPRCQSSLAMWGVALFSSLLRGFYCRRFTTNFAVLFGR